MGNYTILQMFENRRRGRQAKILEKIFRKFQISNRLPNRYFPKIVVGCPCVRTKTINVKQQLSRAGHFNIPDNFKREVSAEQASLPVASLCFISGLAQWQQLFHKKCSSCSFIARICKKFFSLTRLPKARNSIFSWL